jgi:hypothetical protein
MVEGRAMAVFALDDGVGRCTERLKLFSVAVLAIISPLIFDFEILPVFLIPFSIPAKHVAPLIDAEVFRHYQGTGGQDNGHQPQHHIQGP